MRDPDCLLTIKSTHQEDADNASAPAAAWIGQASAQDLASNRRSISYHTMSDLRHGRTSHSRSFCELRFGDDWPRALKESCREPVQPLCGPTNDRSDRPNA